MLNYFRKVENSLQWWALMTTVMNIRAGGLLMLNLLLGACTVQKLAYKKGSDDTDSMVLRNVGNKLTSTRCEQPETVSTSVMKRCESLKSGNL
jgi:hypothetical protein